MVSRMRSVFISAILISFLVFAAGSAAAEEFPVTGIPVPRMQSFDRIITELMMRYEVPGGAVAVVKDGRLILAHGYGWADMDLKQPVQPDSLFRICSISKPVTAVTILKLVEDGRLDLDAKAFRIIEHLKPPAWASVDPRIHNVTVRDLLQHSGGWSRARSFDPMFISERVANAMGVDPPPEPEAIIRYMLGQRLDFDPGTAYEYSNFGYCVLGRIIEKITGQKYEKHARDEILAPMGIASMQIGHTFLKDQAEKEVHYYDHPGAILVRSVFLNTPDLVPSPYGGWYQEALDSHGGWIASAIDLVRFAASVDGLRQPALLNPQTVRLMLSRPSPPLWVGSSYYYGLGWEVRSTRIGDLNWGHTGSLPGSSTILVRTYHGMAWTALFNTRPKEEVRFINEVDRGLWQAASEVTSWPTHDLFLTTSSTATQTSLRTVSSPPPVATSLTTVLSSPQTTSSSYQQFTAAYTNLIPLLAAGCILASVVGVAIVRRKRARPVERQ